LLFVREFPPYLPASFRDLPLNGGRIQSITVNPTNDSHIIVANQFGGLWKTEDGGSRWFHLDGLTTVSAIDVAYGGDGNSVFATLARDNAVDNGGGIWVSRDGGYIWSRPSTSRSPSDPRILDRISGYAITIAPDDANKVYVGTDYGVAKSNDNGNTWRHEMLENTSPLFSDRTQNKVGSILALPDNKAIALSHTGIYIQERPGMWSNIRTGEFALCSGYPAFKTIDVSPFDSDKIFILQDYSNLLLFEISSSRWTTITLPPLSRGRSHGPFVRISRSSSSSTSFEIWVGQGVFLLKATCASIEAARALTSSDWTSLWRPAGIHDDTGYLGLNRSKLPVLYGSDGGPFKPTNREATTWTRAALSGSGLNSYLITDVAGTNINPGGGDSSLYFSTQDNAIWASSDDGVTWPNNDCAEGFFIQVRNDADLSTDVTVAYGKVGCDPSPSMFSDANLLNQRAVPDIDTSGNPLTNMAQAFYITPNRWVRYRLARGSNPEIYLSNNNGLNWRKHANIHLEVRGIFSVSRRRSGYIIYAPFRGARVSASGSEIIGLMRIRGSSAGRILNYDDGNLIYLPNNGSLGVRATEFDWHAIFGVHPLDPDFIIAPDIYNNVVKVSENGGVSWRDDVNLTNEVTNGGRLLLYDQDASHLQVTQISFDPYNVNRILVGTRDSGIILSEDRGRSWTTITGTEVIPYITGFFVSGIDTIVVSSYGRGLWKLRSRLYFPFELYCLGDCTIRFVFDPDPIEQPINWSDYEVVVFLNGGVNGLELSQRNIKSITITPGTNFLRYPGNSVNEIRLNINTSQKGQGFNGLKGPLAAIQNGEIIKALILKDDEIFGIISGKQQFTNSKRNNRDGDNQRDNLEEEDDARTSVDDFKPDFDTPYIFLSSDIPMSGKVILGSKGIIHIFARGFKTDDTSSHNINIIVDEKIVSQNLQIDKNGTINSPLKLPDELERGEHTIKLVQKIDDNEIAATSTFVKANLDDFDEEQRLAT
jgi:hypothetical protein